VAHRRDEQVVPVMPAFTTATLTGRSEQFQERDDVGFILFREGDADEILEDERVVLSEFLQGLRGVVVKVRRRTASRSVQAMTG
jgi:hypothetical protein